MMSRHGWTVYLYGGDANEAECTVHVPIVHERDRERWFSNYNWDQDVFDGWDPTASWWQTMNVRAVDAIRERCGKGDVIGIIAGLCQRFLADELPELLPLEWGIGYEGVFAPYRIYESYAWMHWLFGRDHIADGRFYDAVIPNAFDVGDFSYVDKKDDYLLFLGRHTPRKGLKVVEELAKDFRVITAGQAKPEEQIPGTEYVGVVRDKQRAELLAKARAVVVPTLYIEPFGGVAVEAQISGTPVITTDFGAFAETVDHGVSGFRCHTLGEFKAAVEQVQELEPLRIRARALKKYSMEAIGPQYDAYLARLDTLDGPGWYG